ncbi:hypothetical protein RRG08_031446 [Elysia crispata]|uniref:Uncharacterized protein n=1 Tax=Elysia crispata TaxID=231223 RepID=A0AAE1DJ12_9GAST|nr:hypothetical protein RRG08_031446 [Elysia crispata]
MSSIEIKHDLLPDLNQVWDTSSGDGHDLSQPTAIGVNRDKFGTPDSHRREQGQVWDTSSGDGHDLSQPTAIGVNRDKFGTRHLVTVMISDSRQP